MSKKYIYLLFIVFSLQFGSAQDFRSINGEGNNVQNPEWGSTNSLLLRVAQNDYIDGISIPKLDDSFGKPNPRLISNALFAQSDLINSDRNLSDFTWVFGQFIDHDLTFIKDDESELLLNIVAPDDDEFFAHGSAIPMLRSKQAQGTGTSIDNPRNYNNIVTSYLDGSGIYGSDSKVSNWLRSWNGGKLKVSEGNLLPWNTIDGEHNSSKIDDSAPHMEDPSGSLKKYFVAGDSRANENPLLLAMHTVFVREHNRLCDLIIQKSPFASDEEIYQEARRKNIAYLQHITYNEWLPAMGVEIPEYTGYNPQDKVEIFNEFSASAFRFGHTLINSNIVRMEQDGETIGRGNISLRDAYFNPYVVVLSSGIDPFIKGMGTQVQQELDCKVIDDVRNFLFGGPGNLGLDLAAININRGRERGIPSYNKVRESFGLPTIPSFYELTKNQEEANLLAQTFGSIDKLDSWVGLLAEKHMSEAMMGRLMQVILKEQFQLLRNGDRFFYANDPTLAYEDLVEINNTTFRDILMRNTDIELMQDYVFTAMDHDDIPNSPKPIPVDLDATLFPSVVTDMVNLNVFSNSNSDITIQIISVNGSVILTNTRSLLRGENLIHIPIDADVPHGVYNVLIYNDDDAYTIKKFVKG